jgi:hypothetical protein
VQSEQQHQTATPEHSVLRPWARRAK